LMPEPRTGKRGQKMRSKNAFKVMSKAVTHYKEEIP
jgi:hypothetical protein